jgi:hypothetical protein
MFGGAPRKPDTKRAYSVRRMGLGRAPRRLRPVPAPIPAIARLDVISTPPRRAPQELKLNLCAFGGLVLAVRLAPFVLHVFQKATTSADA